VLTARDLTVPSEAALKRIDAQLWSAWKSSSTSVDGKLLQLAVADELGGRLRTASGHGGKAQINRDELTAHADSEYKDIGGYEGVKAYVRAKWEVTQYLLDKADIKQLELYRGIALDPNTFEKWFAFKRPTFPYHERHFGEAEQVQGYNYMPTLDVQRNGAASTSAEPTVANDWSIDETRVVLRAQVPRTAAVSIPAYGINVHSEKEVVIAGTAWVGWDAWARRAPPFDKVPLRS
jgi:hypothetical protein